MTLKLTTLFLILSLSLDSFFATYSYSVNKIKMSFLNIFICALVAAFVYIISMLCSSLVLSWLDIKNIKILGAITLIIMGLSKLIDPLIKKLIKNNFVKKKIGFKTSSFNIIINIYAEPIKADINKNKTLSIKETLLLSCAINVDTLLAGLMIDSSLNSFYLVGIIAFVINIILLSLGYFLGQKIGSQKEKDYSFLSGFLLIILGIKVLF